MIKFLIQLLCLFVPVRAWRRAIRQKFVGPISRPQRMRRFNGIADWKFETIDGVKVASGNLHHGGYIRLGHIFGKDITPSYVAYEVFTEREYNFLTSRNAVVIDIGMNVGFASLYFALRDDVEAVYAFEPAAPVYEKALFNFSLNECAKKITAHNYGLGDGNKDITIRYDETDSGVTSTMPEFQVPRGVDLTAQVKDAAAEIGGIIAKHPGKTIAIKADCEGAEKEIFERLAAENILPSIHVVVMECHYGYDKLIEQILCKHNFTCFKSGRSWVQILRASNQNGAR